MKLAFERILEKSFGPICEALAATCRSQMADSVFKPQTPVSSGSCEIS